MEERPRRSYYEISVNRFPSKYWHRNIINTMKRILEKYSVSGPVLDLGCGDGLRTRMILGDDLEVDGVDIDPEMLDFAKTRLNNVFHASIDNNLGELIKRKYRVVLLLESLEHVRDPEPVLRNAAEFMENDGLLVVVVPVETPLFRIIWWIWTKTLGKKWKETHLYKFKSAKQLLSLLEKNFEILEHGTTNFNSITIVVCKKRTN
ncbi:MAG: class I SAM-dependent methyltransferase [Candidatus Caldarchaeum sp.]|nr:class I SAM-dependent methyltransferase [Candidatus Caldarchaeum sp.]MCX8200592.1 class I SAM-dependent methyltransferase [Candidatus Caldarchaeum sp.]MDW8063355.1 class I SAM-dependent methyltransferase [Candidatus Caldarchaeum sp.]